jgi:ABC-type multidrug transport system ATPase subunit
VAVRLRGVRKRFGYRDVLRGIDLEVPRGACAVIFGPNGAGKSTTLRIIGTQWGFESGKAEVLGHDVKKNGAEVKARLGIVFHDSFLRREFSLEENLLFAGDLHGMDRSVACERMDELLERLRLSHRRHDPVGTFSQGMTKRASLARSLLHGPDLWLLDEPFSSLDPDGQEILVKMIQEFVESGKTALLVTHQVDLGSRLATLSVFIEEGLVTRSGPGASALEPRGPEVGATFPEEGEKE